MNRILHVALVLLVVLISCGAPEGNDSTEFDEWREDLRYLARELPTH